MFCFFFRSLETNINYNVGVVLAAGSNRCEFPSKFTVLLLPSGTKQRENTGNKLQVVVVFLKYVLYITFLGSCFSPCFCAEGYQEF